MASLDGTLPLNMTGSLDPFYELLGPFIDSTLDLKRHLKLLTKQLIGNLNDL
jgi:hypothetical protein